VKIYFLGTMGWFDTQLGNTLCILVDTGSEYVIFDAGTGFYKIDHYIKDKRPIYLFLSHFHLDHIIGLHALNKFSFSQGINVFGPKGIKKMFSLVINTPYSMPIDKLKSKIKVTEITRKTTFPFDIQFKKLLHTAVCYGYRLVVGSSSIAFCTDTGPCKAINALAGNVDVLITESSLPPGRIDNNWPHLNPQQAALIAKQAKVKQLFLAHFDAGVYLKESDIKLAEKSARRVFKNTIAARDGFCVDI